MHLNFVARFQFGSQSEESEGSLFDDSEETEKDEEDEDEEEDEEEGSTDEEGDEEEEEEQTVTAQVRFVMSVSRKFALWVRPVSESLYNLL